MSQVPTQPPWPAAPPTQPGAIAYRRASSWPNVLGIVSIILGALGAITSLWSAVSWLFLDAVTFGFATTMPGAAEMKQWAVPSVIVALVGLALALFLLFAGIALLKRRRWVPTGLRTWAIFKIILALGAGALTLYVARDQFAATQSQPGVPKPPPGLMNGIAVFSALFTAVWYSVFPIVILCWFARPVIKRETADWT